MDSTKKLLKLVNSVRSQVTKINIQISVSFLYTNNEVTERKIKKKIPLKIAPKMIKYLGISLTKKMKGPHSENYKTLTKEIEDDTNKWTDIPCS